MKKFLFIILIILSLALTQAASFTFKQSSAPDLKLNCIDVNYSICAGTTNCQITVNNPDSVNILNNQTMSYNGVQFNYTLLPNMTSSLGVYTVSMTCQGNNNAFTTFTYKITPNGTEMSTGQGILYLVFLIGAIGIFFLCLYYAVKIPWKHQRDEEGYVIGVNELRYVKLFLIVTCYIILMFTAGLLRGITANYIPDIGVSGLFEWIFWIMLSFMYPIIVCSLIFALIIFLTNKKFQKAIQRGLPIE